MTVMDRPEPDIMTWFPRREDYEECIQIMPDESYTEKLQRCVEYCCCSSIELVVRFKLF